MQFFCRLFEVPHYYSSPCPGDALSYRFWLCSLSDLLICHLISAVLSFLLETGPQIEGWAIVDITTAFLFSQGPQLCAIFFSSEMSSHTLFPSLSGFNVGGITHSSYSMRLEIVIAPIIYLNRCVLKKWLHYFPLSFPKDLQ